MTYRALLFASLLLVGSGALTSCGGGEGDGESNSGGGLTGDGGNWVGSDGGAGPGDGGASTGDGGTGPGDGGASTSDGGAGAGDGGSSLGGSAGESSGGATGEGPCFDDTCIGTCQGSSCDGEWSCNTEDVICTGDLAQYCGCDGVTFQDSGSCPRQAFSHRGPCESEQSFDCDPTKVTCRAAQPACDPPYTYPAVVDGCWGECTPINDCACSENADCPDPQNINENICYTGPGRCGPPLR